MSLLIDELEVKAGEMELVASQGFSQFPRYKKILLIFFLVGIIPGYFLSRFLSGLYWDAQYKNLVITARPSFTQAEDLKVEEVMVTPIGDGIYSAYAYVVNPNLELSAKEARYTFNFFDESGKKVATDQGIFYMLPNGKKYLVAPRVQSSQRLSKAALTFSDVNWQKKTSIPVAKITTNQPSLFDQFDPPALTAQGTIINSSAFLLSEVRIVFLLYDQDKKLITVSQRVESSLQPGERRAYNQLWPNLQTTRVASVSVIAETNVLDSKNLQSKSTQYFPSGASDLSRPELNQ
jgi:hypothetical protein